MRSYWEAAGLSAALAFAVPPTAPAQGAMDKPAVEVGDPVPDFTVDDADGKEFGLASFIEAQEKKGEKERAQAIVLIFWSYDCGVGKKYDKRVKALVDGHKDKPVVFLGVNSNATENAEESKKYLKGVETDLRLLMDADGAVADLFKAKTVTSTAVLDGKGVLRYWGSIDNNKDVGEGGRKAYVENAVNALLEGKKIEETNTKPFG